MIRHLMFLMLASSSVLGATIRAPTVDNPCQIDPTSTGPQEFQPMDQQIDDTITAANLVSTKADAVKQAMVPIHVTQEYATILDQPIHNIPGLPLTLDGGSGTSSNIVDVTKQAYNDLSSYIFYLQMALKQQMAYDSAVLVSEIKETVDSSFALLCKFDTILRSQGIQLTEFVDSSVVRQDIEDVGNDSVKRYQRDYVLMKNANQYVKSVAYTFVELKETL